VIPPALPSVDEVKPQLTKAWMQRELFTRLKAKADELVARVKKGESLEAVAKSVGSDVSHVSINRNAAQQNRTLPPGLLAKIFDAKVGDVVITGGGVAKVTAIKPPPAGMVAAGMAAGQQNFARAIFDEAQEETRAWARNQIKPKINVALARQAIGASDKAAPATGGAVPAAPAGKAQ
jgi:peptidyl-prolyl cis-trans isomerase D